MVDTLIRLFDSDCTEFDSNGIGSMRDALSCVVTEERNGKFELEMDYPVSGKLYKEISLRRLILAKSNPYSKPQAFRIYSISKPINGTITINAQHISYDLSGYPIGPISANGVTNALSTIQNESIIPLEPFVLWTDKNPEINSETLKTTIPNSIRSVLGGIEGSVLDQYGGEYEFDNFTVKLHDSRGRNRGVSIRYGKNLTDLKQEENIETVYTGVYPYWKNDEKGFVELDEKIIYTKGEYNFSRIYILDTSDSFDEPPTQKQLRTKTNTYIRNHHLGEPKVSLTVSFLQLAQSEEYKDYKLLEEVNLCDIVNVEFPEIKVSSTAKCISTKYNVLTDKYNEISLGDAKADLSTTISSQSQSISDTPTKSLMEQFVSRATKLITGGLGGYVVLNDSRGGNQPDEILILDTDSISTAKNVWRWNKGGLGFSSTGYNGEFRTAMTSNGEIVADFITAGTLHGSKIEAGTLEMTAVSDSFTNDLNDKYAAKEDTEKMVTELKASIDGINMSFTKTSVGGMNKVLNSSGLNGLSDWEYNSAYTSKIDEVLQNTTSGSSFALLGIGGTTAFISQQIDVIKSKQYTLSFKSRSKSKKSSIVYVINDGKNNEILNKQEIDDSWFSYKYTFVANTNTITIKAESKGSLLIADIMLVEGETENNWTPAPNEIYTTNVKINHEGINITNSESDTETVIDNTQFAVKHKDEKVLSVNKDLTTLRKTNIEDDLIIGKTRFIKSDVGIDIAVLD